MTYFPTECPTVIAPPLPSTLPTSLYSPFVSTAFISQQLRGISYLDFTLVKEYSIVFKSSILNCISDNSAVVDILNVTDTSGSSILKLQENILLVRYTLKIYFSSNKSTDNTQYFNLILSNMTKNIETGSFNQFWTQNTAAYGNTSLSSASSTTIAVLRISTSSITTSPTSIPTTARPSQLPTSNPTDMSRLPLIVRISPNRVTKDSISLDVSLSADNPFSSGYVYCIASIKSTLFTFSSFYELGAASKGFVSMIDTISLTIIDLKALQNYYIYCGLRMTDGFLSSISTINANKINVTTLCCVDIKITNAPSILYTDTGSTAKDISASIFSFNFPYSPSSTVAVRPRISSLSNSSYGNVSAIPSVIYVTPSSSLQGNFYLNTSTASSGVYKILFEVSGLEIPTYTTESKSIQVISSKEELPAPEMSSALFSNDGAFVYVLFDIPTNQANIVENVFNCSQLFDYISVSATSCTWLNSSVVEISFDFIHSEGKYLSAGDSISLISSDIRAACPSSQNDCSSGKVSSFVTKTVQLPVTALIPAVQLISLPVWSVCDNVTIDASLSTGNGARAWSSIVWNVQSTNDIDNIAISEYLSIHGSNIYKSIVIPPTLMTLGTVYNITLTLSNYLGYSSNKSISISIQNQNEIVGVQVLGGNSFSFTPSQTALISLTTPRSTCSNSSSYIQLSKTLYLNGINQDIDISSSSNPRLIRIEPYTLSSGNIYKVEVRSHVSKLLSLSSSVNIYVNMVKGNIIAIISGGSIRQVPYYKEITLDASSSYDEASASSPLSYVWTCSVLTVSRFGESCDTIFNQSTKSKSSVTLKAYGMSLSLLYTVSVRVVAVDGRYDVANVVITPYGTSVTTAITTFKSLINLNAYATFNAFIQSAVSVNATWTIYYDTNPVAIKANTPLSQVFSAEEVQQGINYPILFTPSTLVRGRSYTLRLTAYPIIDSLSISYAETTITINSPPRSGVIVSSSSSGVESTTSFTFSAEGWVTSLSNYPLQYEFSYQTSQTQPQLVLALKSLRTYVTTLLSSGLASLSYQVNVSVIVYDVYLDSSVATTAVIVTPIVTTSNSSSTYGSLSNNLNVNLLKAFQYGNIDYALQNINIISSTINRVDCSLVNASYCQSIYRGECSDKVNTCGACLSGYVGVIGSSNTLCKKVSSLTNTTSSCNSLDNCRYGTCINGTCEIYSKSCESSTIDICSGHGRCGFVDASDNTVASCLVTNTKCFPKCFCDANYYGTDCSLDEDTAMGKDQLIQTLCLAISNISALQDESSSLLDTISNSLYVSYADSVSTMSTQKDCLGTFNIIANLVEAGYLKAAKSSTISTVMEIFSSFIASGAFNQPTVSSSSATLSDKITTGILATLSDGQTPVTIWSDYIQMIAQKTRSSLLWDSVLSPPATEGDIAYGTMSQSISFDGQAFEGCLSTSGYQSFSLLQYSKNALDDSGSILNPLIQMSYQSASTSSDGNVTISDAYFNSNTSFFISLQYSSEQSYNLSCDLLSDRLMYGSNITYPDCRRYSSYTQEYSDCHGCNLSSYSNYNATFVCYDTSILCDNVITRRRLSQSRSQSRLSSRMLDSYDSNGVSTNLFGAVTRSLENTLSLNPFAFNAEQTLVASTFVACLFGVMFLGVFGFIHWDRLDHDYIIYIKKDGKVLKRYNDWRKYGPVYWQQLQRRRQQQHQKRRQKRNAEFRKRFYQMTRSGHEKMDLTAENLRKLRRSVGMVIQSRDGENKSETESLGGGFFDDALIASHLLQNISMLTLFIDAVCRWHNYLSPFFVASLRRRRIVRWFKVISTLLTAIFFDTLFFSIFFPDNGYCQDFTSKETCLEPINKATNDATCQWHRDLSQQYGGSCSLHKPPSSLLFTITLALLTSIITLPICLLTEIILDEFASKRPNLEFFGINSNNWFGSLTSVVADGKDPKKQNSGKYDRKRRLSESNSIDGTSLDMTKSKGTSQPTSGKDSETQIDFDINTREAIGIYSDFLSPREEVDEILSIVSYLLDQYRANGVLFFNGHVTNKLPILSKAQIMTIHEISECLGINIDGKAIPLTTYQKLIYGHTFRLILSKVQTARDKCSRLIEDMSQFNQTETTFENEYLLQHFILEQLSFFKRFCIANEFFLFDEISPELIDPITWITSWLYLLGLWGFFLYYIYNWTAQNAGTTLSQWGLNFGLVLIQDVFFIQLVKIYVIYVAGVAAARPQLQVIFRTLRNISLRLTSPIDDDDDMSLFDSNTSFQVVQRLSASCRAARRNSISHLYAAQILRLVEDIDHVRCKDSQYTALSYAALLMIFIPSTIALIAGRSSGDILFQTLSTTIPMGFIYVNSILLSISPGLLVTPYVVTVLMIFYRIYIYSPSRRRHINRLLHLHDASMKSMTSIKSKEEEVSDLDLVNNMYYHLSNLLTYLFSFAFLWETKYTAASGSIIWQQMNESYDIPLPDMSNSQAELRLESVYGMEDNEQFWDTSIPANVTEMAPKPITPKSLKLSSKSIARSDVTGIHSSNTTSLEMSGIFLSNGIPLAITDRFTNETMIHENLLYHSLSNAYRENHITNSFDEALRRIYIRLVKSMDRLRLNYRDSMKKVVIYNGYHPHYEYIQALDMIWDRFYPFTRPLSSQEREEVIESFLEWIDIHVKSDYGLYFHDFTIWFRYIYDIIERLEEYESSSVVFDDSSIVIRQAKTIDIDVPIQIKPSSPEVDLSRECLFVVSDVYGSMSFGNDYLYEVEDNTASDEEMRSKRDHSLHTKSMAFKSLHEEIRSIISYLADCAAFSDHHSVLFEESLKVKDLRVVLDTYIKIRFDDPSESDVDGLQDGFEAWVSDPARNLSIDVEESSISVIDFVLWLLSMLDLEPFGIIVTND